MSDQLALQSDLLLAAFADVQEAMPAWARWQAQSQWETHVDFESYLLLPRVYHNLGGSGVDDALFKRLKGVVKRNWVANTSMLAAIGRVARRLQAYNIAAVLLPPAALLLVDRSIATAPGTPIIYRVSRRDAQRAAVALRSDGWRCVADGVPHWSLPGYIAATHRLQLRATDGTALELQWMETGASAGGGNTTHQLHGRTIRSLDTTASIQFLIAGPGSGTEHARLARALLLLGKSQEPAGWHCLLQLLRQRDSPFMDLVVRLSPQSAAGGALGDIGRMAHLDSPPVMERDAQATTFTARLVKRWRHYRAALGDGFSTIRAIRCLPGYLMGKWDLHDAGEIVPRLARAVRYQWRQRNTV